MQTVCTAIDSGELYSQVCVNTYLNITCNQWVQASSLIEKCMASTFTPIKNDFGGLEVLEEPLLGQKAVAYGKQLLLSPGLIQLCNGF